MERVTHQRPDTTLKYRITDSFGSPYAELVLMTNVEGNNGVKPYLNWSKELEIDNTNPLTFTQQSGMTEKSISLSINNKLYVKTVQKGTANN